MFIDKATQTITIIEHEEIIRGAEGEANDEDKNLLNSRTFDALKNFVLENVDEDCNQVSEVMIVRRRNGKTCVKARNYVGMIQTREGTAVEILPKILDDTSKDSVIKTRENFLKMLATVYDDIPFKHLDKTSLKIDNLPLFEIFIKMFLDEISVLVKKGIKSDYLAREGNMRFLKGKLLVGQNIKYNFAHRERFYLAYDEYSPDRPENRLIKSTLILLSKLSKSMVNQSRIREFIFILEDIHCSEDIVRDFNCCKTNRNMSHYEIAIKWCGIFLKKKSFSHFKGSSVAYALLFPMEKVFESYVAYRLRKSGLFEDFNTQGRGRERYLTQCLSNEEKDKDTFFQLKPDMLGKSKDGKTLHIMDTKWKVLNGNDRGNHYGISQSDFYQLLAYHDVYLNDNNKNKKYDKEVEQVVLYLIYPANGKFKQIIKFNYYNKENTKLFVIPWNISNEMISEDEFKTILETAKVEKQINH